MFKVTQACEYHSHASLVAILHRVIVTDRAAGLYHSRYACLVGYLHTVGKGEESVRRHHRPVQVEPERPGLSYGLAQGIHSRGLTYAAGQQHTVLSQHYSVRLGVLDYLICEDKIGLAGLVRSSFCHRSHFTVYAAHFAIALLHGHAAQKGTELHGGRSDTGELEYYTVLFRF